MLSNRAVKSQIEGVTSESDQQAFIDAGLDNRIQKRDKDQTIQKLASMTFLHRFLFLDMNSR
jgi:hypothetical protein